MVTYRQLIRSAFQLASQHPGLWLFGIFVALLGSGGEIEILFQLGDFAYQQGALSGFLSGLVEGGLFSMAALQGLWLAISSQPVSLLIVLLLMLVVIGVGALIIAATTISLGALVGRVDQIARGKMLSVRDSFNYGVQAFWRVFTLGVVARLVIWVVFFILGKLALAQFPGSVLAFLAVFIMIVFTAIATSFIIRFAVFEAVLSKKSLAESVRGALALFKQHWVVTIEIAVLLFLVYWAVNVVLTILVTFIFSYAIELYRTIPLVLSLLSLLLLIVFVVGQVFLSVFHWAAWTLVFDLLKGKKALTSRTISGLKRGLPL